MTSFWILLFIICLPKTGSTGENPADHGHYTHDVVIISRFHDAHHLWRQGHQTFSGFIKARERPGKRGGFWGEGTEKLTQKQKKSRENWTKKTENKDSSKTQKRPQQQRRRGRKSEEEEPSKKQGKEHWKQEERGKTERKKKAEPRLNREKNREEEKATKGRGDWKKNWRNRERETGNEKQNWGKRETRNQKRKAELEEKTDANQPNRDYTGCERTESNQKIKKRKRREQPAATPSSSSSFLRPGKLPVPYLLYLHKSSIFA